LLLERHSDVNFDVARSQAHFDSLNRARHYAPMTSDLTALALSPAEFCARVIPVLSTREAENGLPIGIALRLAQRGGVGSPALLLSIESRDTVVGAAVWTPPHDVVVTRLPSSATSLVAERCVRFGRPLSGTSGPGASGLELAEQLAQLVGLTVRVRKRQRVHELFSVNELPRATGAMRSANSSDCQLVAEWYSQFASEVGLAHAQDAHEWASAVVASGSAFLWQDSQAVQSLACLSRESPNGRAIGPVYTPFSARRRGYATSLVADLARLVLANGKRFAVLFTDTANATSNHIYEQIGFNHVCDYDAYALDPLV